MFIDPLLIPYYAGGLLVIVLLIWIIRIEVKIHKLLSGKDAKSLEDSIGKTIKDLGDLQTFQKESISYFKNVEGRLGQSIQAVETVRFNPFKGEMGSNQSFATAFVNEKGFGVVISSLYSRERVSVFSKPIKNFQSEFELTDEEKQVLNESKQKLNR